MPPAVDHGITDAAGRRGATSGGSPMTIAPSIPSGSAAAAACNPLAPPDVETSVSWRCVSRLRNTSAVSSSVAVAASADAPPGPARSAMSATPGPFPKRVAITVSIVRVPTVVCAVARTIRTLWKLAWAKPYGGGCVAIACASASSAADPGSGSPPAEAIAVITPYACCASKLAPGCDPDSAVGPVCRVKATTARPITNGSSVTR